MKVTEMVFNVARIAAGSGILVGGVTLVTLATYTLSHALYADLQAKYIDRKLIRELSDEDRRRFCDKRNDVWFHTTLDEDDATIAVYEKCVKRDNNGKLYMESSMRC